MGSSSPIFGLKIQKIFELPPPRPRHAIVFILVTRFKHQGKVFAFSTRSISGAPFERLGAQVQSKDSLVDLVGSLKTH